MTEETNYGKSKGTVCDTKEKCQCDRCECESQKAEQQWNSDRQEAKWVNEVDSDWTEAQKWDADIDEEELQEIYHNAKLGKSAAEILKPLSKDKSFRDLLNKQYDGYDKVARKMENYALKCGVELKDPTGFAKGMMYCTTMMNTMTDKSNSKLAEIMIQGINMGIVSLTKISNKLGNEGKSNKLVDEMSDLLQEYLSQTKQFL